MNNTEVKQLKILLVEDEPIARVVLHKMLTGLGYSIDVASDGKQALALSKAEYDVIFMDIGLPDMSGTDVAAEIRCAERKEEKKSAYIVALTAYIPEEIQDKCNAAGMDKLATKPITAQQLQTILMERS